MSEKHKQMADEILKFVKKSSGLKQDTSKSSLIKVQQTIDGKCFTFSSEELDEVLPRMDSDGKEFIQINFRSGIKVLFTDTLVGFKPKELAGLDMNRIPKVVTTPDLLSVFEAIEESIHSDQMIDHEVEILKKVFQSILTGGEAAGFDLTFEKQWLTRLTSLNFKASA